MCTVEHFAQVVERVTFRCREVCTSPPCAHLCTLWHSVLHCSPGVHITTLNTYIIDIYVISSRNRSVHGVHLPRENIRDSGCNDLWNFALRKTSGQRPLFVVTKWLLWRQNRPTSIWGCHPLRRHRSVAGRPASVAALGLIMHDYVNLPEVRNGEVYGTKSNCHHGSCERDS